MRNHRIAGAATLGRRALLAAPAALLPSICFGQDRAAAFPNRPIRMLIPFSPGGGNDILGRLLSDRLSERLGQRVVAENRTGSGGNVGAQALATSRPDGYTLMLGTNGTQSMNQFVFKTMPYDTATAFANVCDIARIPNLLIAAPNYGPRSVAEMVADLRARPGAVSYGSSGVGTMAHLGMELISYMAGRVQMVHVPYRGSAPMLVDLIAGHVQLSMDNASSSKPRVEAGEFRALGVSSTTRWFGMPDLPCISETLPGYEASSWQVVVAPAGTPPPIIAKLNQVLNEILLEPAVKARFHQLGIDPVGGTPEALDRFIQAETERWKVIIAEAGIQPE
jgi:tripartite-type tricarboxylate transporter receptor subunit TctC